MFQLIIHFYYYILILEYEVKGSGSNRKYLAYTTDFCNFDYGYSYLLTDIDAGEAIVRNEDYQFVSFDLHLMTGYCVDGESYYYDEVKYIMDKKFMSLIKKIIFIIFFNL